MKMLVIGVTHSHGISRKTDPNGKSYDICNIHVLQPVQLRDKPESKAQGYGYEASQVNLNPQSLSEFKEFKFPCEIDLIVEPMPLNLNRNWVVGVVKK